MTINKTKLTINKTKYPGICNNCANRSEFYIRCGVHTLQLCRTCLKELQDEAQHLIVGIQEQPEYNRSVKRSKV